MQAALQRQYELYQQKQQQQWQSSHHQPQTLEEVRTLWIGDLQYWMEENYIHSCFAHTNEVVSVKIIRNKLTGQSEGYGFIELTSHGAAEKVLHSYGGTQMPQTEQMFRLNWASFGMGDKRGEVGPDHSIFVGDLAPDVTDYILQETFRLRYPSVRGAKVVMDVISQRSKGYGFVRFGDESEKTRAMTEMNGVYCSSRPMRISTATPRKAMAAVQQVTPKDAYLSPADNTSPFSSQNWIDNDPNNTTIFVGGLDPSATEDDLRRVFSYYGELIYVKIPPGKGCGFVQYTYRSSAEEALAKLHGTVIGQQAIRLSWGRSMQIKQPYSVPSAWGQDPSQWSNGYYGYGVGVDGYSYDAAAQDLGQYGYAGYQNYQGYPQPGEGDLAAGSADYLLVGVEEEIFDPLAPPDVDKLNDAYISLHESSILGRHLWLETSEQLMAS
ncbi:hypothetical protein GOP47_0013049 [Adiantum capillus-veneris]|uniref:RRM domain-containing protein n=1 Tax=Adiantum capillus-veneris TaxID=13818 RepID=A0A9D4URV6_ADICA|nr:hypothetical protein GOP47_0013049 [Adiantum capillus-veneris]